MLCGERALFGARAPPTGEDDGVVLLEEHPQGVGHGCKPLKRQQPRSPALGANAELAVAVAVDLPQCVFGAEATHRVPAKGEVGGDCRRFCGRAVSARLQSWVRAGGRSARGRTSQRKTAIQGVSGAARLRRPGGRRVRRRVFWGRRRTCLWGSGRTRCRCRCRHGSVCVSGRR